VPVGLGVVAIALAIWSLALEIPDLKWWSTTLQLVGAVVAFLGFSGAYVRAECGLTLRAWVWQQLLRFARRVKLLWDRLRHKPIIIRVQAGAGATMGAGTPLVATYPSPLVLDQTLPLEQQVAQLADYANKLQQAVPKLKQEIHRLDGRIDEAQAGASELAEKLLAHLRDAIDQLSKRLNEAQVLDLRWAIFGLAITVVGTLMSYWA
jgi:hypothetical protein